LIENLSYACAVHMRMGGTLRWQDLRLAVLSDSATSSNLNASYFLTGKDNIMLNPIFGTLSSRAIQNIPDMIGYL